jgi:hypothetical protein
MSIPTKNPPTIFPDLPRESPLVDKDGNVSHLWGLGFANLFQQLQQNFGNEGILFPTLTTDEANQILSRYTIYYPPGASMNLPLPPGIKNISGQVIYNVTISAPQIFILSFDGATPPNVTLAKWYTFAIS